MEEGPILACMAADCVQPWGVRGRLGLASSTSLSRQFPVSYVSWQRRVMMLLLTPLSCLQEVP